MLKIIAINTNSPVFFKTTFDVLLNMTSLQSNSQQAGIHRQNVLIVGDGLRRTFHLKNQLTCCSHDCKFGKCSESQKICATIIPMRPIFCGTANSNFIGLFLATGYKKNFFVNKLKSFVFVRNYSSKSTLSRKGSNPCDCDCDGDGDGSGAVEEEEEEDNLTAVLYKVEDLRLEQRPIPEISDTDVLLAMDCVGICGSDVHYWTKGRIGDFILKKPMVIGHEGAGIVKKVGKKVRHLQKGDRVAIEPGVPCRMCDFCRRGIYNLCPDMRFCATPPIDGNLARYYKHPADFCFKLPPHVTMEEGSLLEPLSCGVHACARAHVEVGSEVLIFGCGPIGLSTLTVAKAMGATRAIVLDPKEDRLKIAKKMGATATMLVKPDTNPKDLAKAIKKRNYGVMPDKAFDCVGTEQAVKTGIFATRSGGVIILVGMGDGDSSLPLPNALAREVDIRGIFRYCNDYKRSLALVASKRVKALNHMITHHFTLEETEEAFETVRCNSGGAIKVIIHIQPKDKNNPKEKEAKSGKGKKGKGKREC